MFFGVVLITSKDEEDKLALYTELEQDDVSFTPSANTNRWSDSPHWGEETDDVLSHPISFRNDIPEVNVAAASLPTPILGRGPRPVNPRRRTSFDNGIEDSNALKRLSGMFQAVGSSVGTHTVRQMEFDLCSEVHAKSKSPRVSLDA